jgi:addiction module HigA family antidote
MMSKSRTTTDDVTRRKLLPLIHPGEILAEDLQDAGVSLNQLARCLRVPMNRISAIVNGKRSITAGTAMRLARYFGTSPQYWMNLQIAYDLAVEERNTGALVDREVLPRHAA